MPEQPKICLGLGLCLGTDMIFFLDVGTIQCLNHVGVNLDINLGGINMKTGLRISSCYNYSAWTPRYKSWELCQRWGKAWGWNLFRSRN